MSRLANFQNGPYDLEIILGYPAAEKKRSSSHEFSPAKWLSDVDRSNWYVFSLSLWRDRFLPQKQFPFGSSPAIA